MTKAKDEAMEMLPSEMRELLDRMCKEYQFACFKHHGLGLVSPKVLAELILMGWMSSEAGENPVPSDGTVHIGVPNAPR